MNIFTMRKESILNHFKAPPPVPDPILNIVVVGNFKIFKAHTIF